jgi:hypothetical protein
MLYNAENIALQNLQILYTFVLRAEIATTFGRKWYALSSCSDLFASPCLVLKLV